MIQYDEVISRAARYKLEGCDRNETATKVARELKQDVSLVNMMLSELFVERPAEQQVEEAEPAVVETPKPAPTVRPDGLPLDTTELTDLILGHDVKHIYAPVALIKMASTFWRHDRNLSPACFDVLLAITALWNRRGCPVSNNRALVHVALAELSRILGHKRYGGWQHGWLLEQLKKLQDANLLDFSRCKRGRRSILIRLAPELSPTTKQQVKPFDLVAYRSLRSPLAKYTFVRAGYQTASRGKDQPSGTGQLSGKKLAEDLDRCWSPSREKKRLDTIQRLLDTIPLYQDCQLRVLVEPCRSHDGGWKFVFKTVGKAVAKKAVEQSPPKPEPPPPETPGPVYDTGPSRISDVADSFLSEASPG